MNDTPKLSGPSLAEMEELYDRAYRDWQVVSMALIGRQHGTAAELTNEIERLKKSAPSP